MLGFFHSRFHFVLKLFDQKVVLKLVLKPAVVTITGYLLLILRQYFEQYCSKLNLSCFANLLVL